MILPFLDRSVLLFVYATDLCALVIRFRIALFRMDATVLRSGSDIIVPIDRYYNSFSQFMLYV